MQPVKTAGQIRFYAAPSVQYIPPPTPIITAQSLVKIMRSQAPGECWTAGWPVWVGKRGRGEGGRGILNSKHNSGSDSHYQDINTSSFQTYAGILVDHL